uniref:C6 domain-containing protein n=1 Tax=Heterorhabditis bacteriophora TaxID=37862 RepID=A0A1I7X829_HETBA
MCNLCENIDAESAVSLGSNEDNGMLVLTYDYELMDNCRVVIIRCKGSNPLENSTILFNGMKQNLSAPDEVSTSLTCSHTGKWIRLEEEIVSVSCRVSIVLATIENIIRRKWFKCHIIQNRNRIK